MAQVAQDTFVAELSDGSSLRVTRGSTWADRHEVVKMDGGRGHLFKPLDIDDAGADAPKSDPAEPAAGAAEPEAGAEAEPEAPAAEPDAAAEPVRAARSRRGAAKASS